MTPKFAVVGHPNKGKSSVVSTLARDDSVAVSMKSGTTTQAQEYAVSVEQYSYLLIDTPGFQRPRKVLAWLQSIRVSADQRINRVHEFLQDEQCQKLFVDEIALLTPIMQGAAILYVVDGSRPYSAEYEAEMEILRWTGQPSMALINPIDSDQHILNWQQALGQYFSLVRVFDAVKATLDQHIQLLTAFTQLHQPWAPVLNQIIQSLQEMVISQQYKSCAIAAKLLEDLCGYQIKQKTLSKEQAEAIEPLLESRYMQWMRECEKQAHNQLQIIYRHHYLKRQDSELKIDDDLFDTSTWLAWGLSKSQLTKVAAIAGAAAGSMLDLAVAGQTFMLGALTGGVLASTTAWFTSDKLMDVKVRGLALGGFEARQGPISNSNFPYVVLARFLYINQALKNRNHALREDLTIDERQVSAVLDQLKGSQKKKIYVALDRLTKQKEVKDLTNVLTPLFVDQLN